MVATATRLRPRRIATLAGVGIAMGAMVVHAAAMVALVLPVMVGALVVWVVVRHFVRWPDDPAATTWVMRWAMLAMAVHLLFGLLVSSFGAAHAFLAPDSFYYHTGAVALVNHWRLGLPFPALPSGKEGFFYLLAGIYWVVGPHAVAGLAINAALGAAAIPVISDVTYRLAGPKAARRVPPLLMLLPGFLVWDSQLLREPGVLLLMALGAYFALRITERATASCLVGFTLSVALLLTFRGYLAPLIGAALLCGVAVGKRHLLAGVGAGASAMAIAAVLTLTLGLGYSGLHLAASTNLQQANYVRQGFATGVNSGYGAGVDVSTPTAALSYLPIGFLNAVLGPFPWQVHGFRQSTAVPDVLIWWFLIPKVLRGYRVLRRRRERRVFIVVLPSLAVALVLALVIGNYGTLVRERMQIIVPLMPLIAIGWPTPRHSGPRSDQVGSDEDRSGNLSQVHDAAVRS